MWELCCWPFRFPWIKMNTSPPDLASRDWKCYETVKWVAEFWKSESSIHLCSKRRIRIFQHFLTVSLCCGFFVVWHKSCVNHRIVSIYPKTRCHPPMGCWGCHSYQCFTELPHWYCQIEFGSPKMWRVNRGFEDPKLVEVICGFFVRVSLV